MARPMAGRANMVRGPTLTLDYATQHHWIRSLSPHLAQDPASGLMAPAPLGQ